MTQIQERRSEDDAEFEKQAAAAIQEHRTAVGPGRRLTPLLAELTAAYPPHAELTDQARLELAQFDRDDIVLRDHVAAEVETLFALKGGALWLEPPPFIVQPPELKHFYGPDPAGTGPNRYTLNWGHVDPFAGTGSGARPNAADGTFSASHYATGNSALSAFAGIGVRMTPNLDWCHLRIRPLVQWTGADILNHHNAMPELNERRRGRASCAIGILVQSWAVGGGAFHQDADHWVDMWDRNEVNPTGARDYDGTVDANALQVEILASGNRRYAIWVYCWAYVESQTGFAVATRSSAMIRCHMPYLFVEEVRI